MATATKTTFLFLACDGETGRSASSMRHLKQQHAQVGNKCFRRGLQSVSNEAKPPLLPVPVQIRFSSSAQPEQVQNYTGRCSRCRKRRKLANCTGRCGPCDKHGPLRVTTQCPTLDLPYDSALLPYCQTSLSLPAVICEIPCGMQCCPADQKAMHYFLNYAALDLSGYILRDFWNGFVLQASHSEPMVRQAVLAVSSAHLDRCSGMGLTSPTSLASYQASMKTLRKYMIRKDKPSPELVLLCCILLFTFDRLCGDDAAAVVHLQSAMSILKNARRMVTDDSKTSMVTRQNAIADLSHVLIRMDIEDTMPDLDRGPLLDLAIDSIDAFDNEPLPMKFFSPRDFMEPWMETCHAVWTFVGRNAKYRNMPLDQIPPAILTHRRNLQRWIKAWRAAFKDYISRLSIPNITNRPTPSPALNALITDAINTLIIESHYFVIKSVLAECLPTGPLHPWDLIAEKMLQTGSKALALRHAHRRLNSLATRRTFSTHVGIAESLLCLSHRTRSPEVRRKAQELIAGFRDVEGGDLTGVTAFFAGRGKPPRDLVLVYERPGH